MNDWPSPLTISGAVVPFYGHYVNARHALSFLELLNGFNAYPDALGGLMPI